MKKLLVGLALLAFIALAIYFAISQPAAVEPAETPDQTQIEQPSVIEPVEIPANTTEATIDYVHDGDTLFLTDGTKVRLLAVDTPEVGDNAECYGTEARDYLRDLLPEGSTIYTQVDVEATDQYGRSLLFIYTASGTLVNLQLVDQGFAEAVFIGANRLYEDEFEAAEAAAQQSGRGIWGNC